MEHTKFGQKFYVLNRSVTEQVNKLITIGFFFWMSSSDN